MPENVFPDYGNEKRKEISSNRAENLLFGRKLSDNSNVGAEDPGEIPLTTLIEFTLDGASGQDFYDTRLVNGYNVPFLVNAEVSSGNYSVSACGANINTVCPPELKVTDEGGAIIACKSTYEVFNTDEYYCNPNKYSTVFKQAYPMAYSYAYNDKMSTFTCKAPTYILTFCPTAVWFRLSLQS
ncbi:pathogenesis-related protein 5-like [Aristolochia californica]|uniref:pathogenesis-related protein 5-like n=1 Tax=Aristolochia californica TaxID=171875 RepID=UPI0035DE027C